MKKKIAGLLCSMFAATVAVGSLAACSGNRNNELIIYNWNDYMDSSIYSEFEDWYYTQTQKKIKVKTQEFDSNEDAYTMIKAKKKDYDLFCPSDYMIDRMSKEGLLKELDNDIIKMQDFINADILEMAKAYDPANKYSMPYLFGTFGIMYNTNEIAYGEIDSWSAIFTDTYSKAGDERIYMKNQVRDSYATAGIYANRDTLSSLSNNFTDYNETYQAKLSAIFADTSDAAIAAAKKALSAQKPYVYNYETDDGKFEMASASASAGHLGLFWSCDAGYVMNDYEDEKGEIQNGNRNIFYTVPKEGSNVYIDAFVIPAYAKNESAANYFLRFLCEKDVAYKNMTYAGATSPVTEAYNQYKAELNNSSIDEEGGFFNVAGKSNEYKTAFKQMYIDMVFPPQDVLNRCAVMTDLAGAEQRITQMFIDVKGN